MKQYINLLIIMLLAGFISCSDDFLTNSTTEQQAAGEPATEGAILSNLAATYQILLFDSYADNNYNSLVLMSDLRSDDIFKGGGDAGDQHQLYLLSLFTTTPQENINGLWNIFYSGLARANNVISACENAVGFDTEADIKKLNQYKAEAHFLRAYYTHWLWKFWGNVPYFEEPLTEPPYMTRQYTADEVYAEIMEDIDVATTEGYLPMKTVGINAGRINRAAALMLKARVVLYQKDSGRYGEVTADMAEIIAAGDYSLMPDFAEIWVDAGEFNQESIFEANHLPEGKTWASGWQGYGTNLPAFISPNGLNTGNETGNFKGGWGFGPVRQSTWDIYEEGDTRREGSINNWEPGQYTARFQDTGLFMAKYAARVGYNPQGDVDLNYCNNLRIYRYAETLLTYAEMIVIHGQSEVQGITAQSALDQVRQRAFGAESSIPVTAANIKLERRREFVGEGMRFWDIVRWGDTALLTENLTEFNSVRTWNDNFKYLPIPQSEIDKTAGTEFALEQNPGYN
ncbi:MAG TPA: RagB/SusD family nutrient uptake outer membrane protein [Proteiniphilum sp.]|nr:RagB/SusD family nutrient uptake outer membrane protein [Proteiniphilum sp.]HPJ50921.1 RagB/SusD family nutrient uptake outer membrane protein [Proteiniphilum sp.]HPR19104.1 RagB/SusD family nutrient uptake outer membrane protein [Proteiniphilum sp.]